MVVVLVVEMVGCGGNSSGSRLVVISILFDDLCLPLLGMGER